jgi:hypothetical protein
MVLGNLLALAGVCPFVGSLSDLMGRRYVALVGSLFVMVGMIICSTAHSMNPFIGKFIMQMLSTLLIPLQEVWSLLVLELVFQSSLLWLLHQRWLPLLSVENMWRFWCLQSSLSVHLCYGVSLSHTTQVKSFPHPLGNQTLTVFNRLEMVRTALWCMDCHRFFHDAILLLPTTTSEFRWTKQQGNFGTN